MPHQALLLQPQSHMRCTMPSAKQLVSVVLAPPGFALLHGLPKWETVREQLVQHDAHAPHVRLRMVSSPKDLCSQASSTHSHKIMLQLCTADPCLAPSIRSLGRMPAQFRACIIDQCAAAAAAAAAGACYACTEVLCYVHQVHPFLLCFNCLKYNQNATEAGKYIKTQPHCDLLWCGVLFWAIPSCPSTSNKQARPHQGPCILECPCAWSGCADLQKRQHQSRISTYTCICLTAIEAGRSRAKETRIATHKGPVRSACMHTHTHYKSPPPTTTKPSMTT